MASSLKNQEKSMIFNMMLLAVAGALGTLARFGLSSLAQQFFGGRFPWGTFSVNLVGCLCFGIVWSLLEERSILPPESRLFILTGFMGAFTTFSTWSYESYMLVREGAWIMAGTNIVIQPILGILLFAAGSWAAKHI
jgi:fluoride exporter